MVPMYVPFKIHYRNNLIDTKDSYLIPRPPSWDDRKYSYGHQLYPSVCNIGRFSNYVFLLPLWYFHLFVQSSKRLKLRTYLCLWPYVVYYAVSCIFAPIYDVNHLELLILEYTCTIGVALVFFLVKQKMLGGRG